MSEKEQIGKLLGLLEQKDFDALSVSEKTYVLQQMTQEDYEEERAVIVGSGQIVPLNVPVEVDGHLKMAFRSHTVATKKPFLQYQMPLWQVLLVAAGISLFWWSLGTTTNRVEVPKIETIYVHTTDTIYKEIENQVQNQMQSQMQSQSQIQNQVESQNQMQNQSQLEVLNQVQVPILDNQEKVEMEVKPKVKPRKNSNEQFIFANDMPLQVNDLLTDEPMVVSVSKGKSVADDTTLISYQMKVY